MMDDRRPTITIAHIELEWTSARDFGTYRICAKLLSNAHSEASIRAECLHFGLGFILHQLSVYRAAFTREISKLANLMKIALTLKALIVTAADHRFCDIFPNFRRR